MIQIRPDPNCDCDVLVVGAGPAGASAAIHLTRSGLKVILIDCQSFTRDKVCGDFVSPLALFELARIGITSLPDFKRTNKIHKAALYLDGKVLISQPIPKLENLPSYGRVIPRLMLDNWILAAARDAGVSVFEGFRLTHFEKETNGIWAQVKGQNKTITFRTQLLIGADGSRSTIRHLLSNRPISKDNRIIAVRTYFKGINGRSDRADLYFSGDSFPGYCWLFPINHNAANVGVGMIADTIPHANYNLRKLLKHLIENDEALSRRLRGARRVGRIIGWPLITYKPEREVVADRVVLIGDAAGLINPLNGEGIQYALLSGRWVSETILMCATQQDYSRESLENYSVRVEKELSYDMALAALIVELIRNRRLNPIWLQALRIIVQRAEIDPDYAHTAGGVLAGMIPASNVLNSKFITKTLKQGALSTMVGAVKNLVRGPHQTRKTCSDAAQTGFVLIKDTIQHPTDFLKWGFRLSAGSAELAGQVFKDLILSSDVTKK
jgi:geranylgeranyl reductase family protein